MEIIGDSSQSSFNGVVRWKLYYSKLTHKGEPVLAMAEYLVLD